MAGVTLLLTFWELGLTCLSLAVMCLYVSWVARRGLHGEALLPMAFLGGYAISWCFGFLGYRYLLAGGAYGSALGTHFVTTASLVLVAVSSTVGGAWVVLRGARVPGFAFEFRPDPRRLTVLLGWFGVLFAIYQVAQFLVQGTGSRWEQGNVHAVGSDSYIVVGLRCVAYPFYFLLGISARERLFSAWNIGVAGVVLAMAGINALTGGRTVALEPILVSMIGLVFSALPWKRLFWLGLFSAPLLAALIVVVGMARGSAEFSEGGLSDKMSATSKVVTEGSNFGNAFDDPMFNLFTRLFEPSAQLVIDVVTDTGKRVHFLNVERLMFVLVPRLVYPNKAALNDGNQRLVSDYGYIETTFSSVPLTLIADAYERFGFGGVAGYHLLAGALLAGIGRLMSRLANKFFVILMLGCMARAALMLYPESNLGFFNIVIYSYLRDFVVVGSVFLAGWTIAGSLAPGARRFRG